MHRSLGREREAGGQGVAHLRGAGAWNLGEPAFLLCILNHFLPNTNSLVFVVVVVLAMPFSLWDLSSLTRD